MIRTLSHELKFAVATAALDRWLWFCEWRAARSLTASRRWTVRSIAAAKAAIFLGAREVLDRPPHH